MPTGKIESITAEAEKKLDSQAAAAMSTTTRTNTTLGGTGGMLLGAGVTIAALSSALAYVSNKLAENHWAILTEYTEQAILAAEYQIQNRQQHFNCQCKENKHDRSQESGFTGS